MFSMFPGDISSATAAPGGGDVTGCAVGVGRCLRRHSPRARAVGRSESCPSHAQVHP